MAPRASQNPRWRAGVRPSAGSAMREKFFSARVAKNFSSGKRVEALLTKMISHAVAGTVWARSPTSVRCSRAGSGLCAGMMTLRSMGRI